MPGVNVTTAARSGPSTPLRATSGQLFVAGLAERGSTTDPILLRGMADYEEQLGGRVTYGFLYDQLKVFFDEGGTQAYVARVVGAAATVGSLTLQDRNGVPANTLRIDAANAGAWSSTITIEVLDGSLANTFRIRVAVSGTVVEDRTNLASPTAAVTAFANSPYIRVVNLGSATAAPNNNPAVAAAAPLTAGNDDRAAVVTANYVTALSRFGLGLGDGAVAIPGLGTAVHAGLIAHAKDYRRVALLSAAVTDDTTAELNPIAAALDTDYAGLFAPYVRVTDDAGGYREISPEGYVAACRARAHDQVGPWRAPAGLIASANTLLGLSKEFTRAEADALDAGRVNAIRTIAGTVRLYGWRSLSKDEANFFFLSGRDVLNRLVVEGERRLEEYVFSPIDSRGQLLSAINAALVGIVEPMRQANGLFENVNEATGDLIDPGYRVDTGPSVNSTQSLANNEVKARLSVRVSPTGALVSLTIVKVGVLSGL